MVVLMIFVGGLTRLTDSGLSIVEWKPVSGIIPPLNTESWEKEFSSYKTSPEYQKLNANFTLDDFKNIFWLEFIHRILGRITGLIIIFPAIFFGIKNQLRKPMPYVSMSLLVIFQGVIGWYMVKSGLVDNPHVSHYRLALHLILATLLYSVIMWENFLVTNNTVSIRRFARLDYGIITLLLIYTQIFLGALVAGLDAGMIYNEFPMMDGKFIPTEFELSWNMLNDPVSVQFLHRNMAYIVVFSVFILAAKTFKYNKNLAFILISIVLIQFLLGIFTLLYIIPINLALAHQLFAVLLLSVVLYIIFERRAS
jgi:cytochrome c oxidase assembly protein subunit 15